MNRKKLILFFLVLILFVAGIVMYKLQPRNQGLYKVTILPSLGGDCTIPQSINEKGYVAGYSTIAPNIYHLFLWDKESDIQDLGPIAQDNIFINNKNQIAANMIDPNGNHLAFIWDPNTGRTILPTLGGKYSNVMGINNNGQIIGWSETSTSILQAFVWDEENGIHNLTLTNTNESFPSSINDSGQVIVSEKNTTFLVETDKEFKITSLPNYISGRPQLNNNGHIAGIAKSAQVKLDIVLWHPDSGLKTLFRLNSACFPKINEHNQIIITDEKDFNPIQKFLPAHLENYLIDPKIGRISLNGYLNIEREENLFLNDINNDGCIIGAIQSTKSSKSVGVLFEPIPEKMEKAYKK